MICRVCSQSCTRNSLFCEKCIQSSGCLDKYPGLRQILDPGSLALIGVGSWVGDPEIGAKCQKCEREFRVSLVSLLKQVRRNAKKRVDFLYHCHRCSKAGKTKITVDSLKSVIDLEQTIEKFGGLPDNVKKGKVVARCEDCKKLSEVKLSSILHQARRHQMQGRTCIYKCFDCGVQRPDALAKSIESRLKQLKEGFKSGLETAMENRLNYLGIKSIYQFPLDMYTWDFFLPEHNLLVDVNGEYWHSLPENVVKDKAKFTYTQRYKSEYEILRIDEKNFLNPLMVDKIILDKLGLAPYAQFKDFELSSIQIARLDTTSVVSRKPYVDFLNSYHYSMTGRHGKVVFGAFLNEELVAVCKFNSVIRQEVASSLGLKCYQVLELDRFCIHPSYQKKNLASWFISRCTKQLFDSDPKILGIVSFADETFGHSGTIYKAANWSLVGKTSPSYHYMDSSGIPIHKKRIYDIASKLCMKEAEYAAKHSLAKFREQPKLKFVLKRSV